MVGKSTLLLLWDANFPYFHAGAIEHAVNTMAEALTSDGYVLAGHGEFSPKAVRLYTAGPFQILPCITPPKRFVPSLRPQIYRNIAITMDSIVVAKLLFIPKARVFSFVRENDLCANGG